MKISELIKRLRQAKKAWGDIEVNVRYVTLKDFEEFNPETLEWDEKTIAYIVTKN